MAKEYGNITKVRNRVKAQYPNLVLTNGNGYMYWDAPNDDDLDLFLCSLFTASIAVNQAKDASVCFWMAEAKKIMDAYKKYTDNPEEFDFNSDDPTSY